MQEKRVGGQMWHPQYPHLKFCIEFPLWKRGLLPLNDPTSIQFQTIEHNFDQTFWAAGGTQTAPTFHLHLNRNPD